MKRLVCAAAAVILAAASAYAEGEAEFTAQNRELDGKVFHSVKAVRVEGAFCAVSAAGGSVQGVKVGVSIEDEYTAVHYEVKGDTLHVWVERDWDLFTLFPTGENTIDFSLPEGTDYLVNTSSGNIELKNHRTDTIKLVTASGSIEARACSGDMVLSSSSGNIKLMEAKGDVKSRTASGDQLLENIRGSLTCRSGSGNLELNDVGGDVKAHTASGSVTVTGVTGRELDIRSLSGAQRLSSVNAALNISSVSGEIAGERITLGGASTFHTTSGQICLELTNREDCSFTLKSVSGSLAVGEERSRKRLTIPAGDIQVKATSLSGSIRIE